MSSKEEATSSQCSVCGKTGGTLKCSRCKSDDYHVCSKDCQAQDWKRHKRHECYVYNEERVQDVQVCLDQLKNQNCPICLEPITKLDVLRDQLEGMMCEHSAHVACLTKLRKAHRRELQNHTGTEEELEKKNLFTCPLCRQWLGSTDSLGHVAWYQTESSILIHMALGFMFQQYTQSKGTAAEEFDFIQSCVRETEKAGLRATALVELNVAKDLFLRLLPDLKRTPTAQKRHEMTIEVILNIMNAIYSHVAPFDRNSEEFEKCRAKWMPFLMEWMKTLMIFGPYV